MADALQEHREKRGLTVVELHLLAIMHGRLIDVLGEVHFALRDGTAKHALTPLRSLKEVWTGAAVMLAMLEGR